MAKAGLVKTWGWLAVACALPPHVETRFCASLSRLVQLAATISDWTMSRSLRVPDQRPFFAPHPAASCGEKYACAMFLYTYT